MQPNTRREIEEALYEAVPHGAYKAVADERNVARQNVSKYYDYKSGEYQSVFSKALLELQFISRVCPAWGRAILRVVNYFGVRWCGVPKASGMTDVVTLTAKVFDPATPHADRLPLALKLQDEVNKMVDGLRFDGIEDSPPTR